MKEGTTMAAQIIDGKQIALDLKNGIRGEVESLKRRGLLPGLATLLVGENPASQIYVRNKHKACEEVGIASFHHALPKETDTRTVLEKINAFNQDPNVHGILVQLPLPPQVDTDRVLLAVRPDKDADGFHPENLGRLLAAKTYEEITQGERRIPVACTPFGVIALLEKIGVPLAGKSAVVIGRSTIVGKPAALLLLSKHCTVSIAHSQTKNLPELARQADVLIAAIGKARFVTGEMVKPGAAVVDVGINRLPDGKLCGDVDFEAAREKAGWITPVPGGVGPMTIAMLMHNTLLCAKKIHAL